MRDVLSGKSGAWQQLVSAVTPRIVAITRAHPSMRERKLSSLEDDVAEVTTSSLERLARDDFKNLRRYLEKQTSPEKPEQEASFESWLYGTVDFTIRDHIRKRFGRAQRAGTERKSRPSRRDLGTLAKRLDEEPLDRELVNTLGATKRLTAAQILAYATTHFAHDEVRALRLFYFEDKSMAEIADALGLGDERAAEKLIRKLNARLRYQFAQADDRD